MKSTDFLRRLIPVIFASISLQAACAPPEDAAVRRDEDALRVLFVGNSFTYYNRGIDRLLQRMAEERYSGRRIVIDSLTRPSETFRGHYRHAATAEMLAAGGWDYVILQAASFEPARHDTRAGFLEYGSKLIAMVRAHGAEPLLFQTWAWQSDPGMHAGLADGYRELGRLHEVRVVPVGDAWEAVRRASPAGFLFADNRHPSRAGTYLAACVFFSVVFAESPEGLTFDAGLSRDVAEYLQRVAWQLAGAAGAPVGQAAARRTPNRAQVRTKR